MTLAKDHPFPLSPSRIQLMVNSEIFSTILMVVLTLESVEYLLQMHYGQNQRKGFFCWFWQSCYPWKSTWALDSRLFSAPAPPPSLTLVNTKSGHDQQRHFHKGSLPYSCVLNCNHSPVIFTLNYSWFLSCLVRQIIVVN